MYLTSAKRFDILYSQVHFYIIRGGAMQYTKWEVEEVKPRPESKENRYRREAYEEMLEYFGGKIPEGFEWDYNNADLIPVGQRQ